MLTDSHTHIYSGEYASTQKEVVKRAIDAGVNRMFMPNIDSASVIPMLDLARDFPDNCFPMMGLHPTSVMDNYREELDKTEVLAFSRPFSGIGEIGIDLYWDKNRLKEQRDSFIVQIGWARQLDLPVVIHSRESFREICDILDKEQDGSLKGVFHSFTGSIEEAEKALSYGFYLGINGIVTFKNSRLPETLKSIPPERLLLETDSPYLSPVPFRGKQNESAHLVYIAQKLSEIYGITMETIASVTTASALSLFKIPN